MTSSEFRVFPAIGKGEEKDLASTSLDENVDGRLRRASYPNCVRGPKSEIDWENESRLNDFIEAHVNSDSHREHVTLLKDNSVAASQDKNRLSSLSGTPKVTVTHYQNPLIPDCLEKKQGNLAKHGYPNSWGRGKPSKFKANITDQQRGKKVASIGKIQDTKQSLHYEAYSPHERKQSASKKPRGRQQTLSSTKPLLKTRRVSESVAASSDQDSGDNERVIAKSFSLKKPLDKMQELSDTDHNETPEVREDNTFAGKNSPRSSGGRFKNKEIKSINVRKSSPGKKLMKNKLYREISHTSKQQLPLSQASMGKGKFVSPEQKNNPKVSSSEIIGCVSKSVQVEQSKEIDPMPTKSSLKQTISNRHSSKSPLRYKTALNKSTSKRVTEKMKTPKKNQSITGPQSVRTPQQIKESVASTSQPNKQALQISYIKTVSSDRNKGVKTKLPGNASPASKLNDTLFSAEMHEVGDLTKNKISVKTAHSPELASDTKAGKRNLQRSYIKTVSSDRNKGVKTKLPGNASPASKLNDTLFSAEMHEVGDLTKNKISVKTAHSPELASDTKAGKRNLQRSYIKTVSSDRNKGVKTKLPGNASPASKLNDRLFSAEMHEVGDLTKNKISVKTAHSPELASDTKAGKEMTSTKKNKPSTKQSKTPVWNEEIKHITEMYWEQMDAVAIVARLNSGDNPNSKGLTTEDNTLKDASGSSVNKQSIARHRGSFSYHSDEQRKTNSISLSEPKNKIKTPSPRKPKTEQNYLVERNQRNVIQRKSIYSPTVASTLKTVKKMSLISPSKPRLPGRRTHHDEMLHPGYRSPSPIMMNVKNKLKSPTMYKKPPTIPMPPLMLIESITSRANRGKLTVRKRSVRKKRKRKTIQSNAKEPRTVGALIRSVEDIYRKRNITPKHPTPQKSSLSSLDTTLTTNAAETRRSSEPLSDRGISKVYSVPSTTKEPQIVQGVLRPKNKNLGARRRKRGSRLTARLPLAPMIQKRTSSDVKKKKARAISMPVKRERRKKNSIKSKTMIFKRQFRLFAKLGDKRNSGKCMTINNSNKWLQQAGIIDNRKVTTNDTEIYFIHHLRRRRSLSMLDYLHFLKTLAVEKRLNIQAMIERMMACGPPKISAAEFSLVDIMMTLPSSTPASILSPQSQPVNSPTKRSPTTDRKNPPRRPREKTLIQLLDERES